MKKLLNGLILGTAVLLSFSSCGDNNINESSVIEKAETATVSTTTATTTTTTSKETESTLTETTVPETTVETTVTEAPEVKEKADLSFLYGAPNGVFVWAKMISCGEIDGIPQANVDVTDTGSCYRLGISKVQYSLGINELSLSELIYDSVEFAEYVQDEEGKGKVTYTILPEKAEFTFYGEVFTLTSYYENDSGRGYCEFLGEDGEKYYINNILSPELDNFTSEIYFKLITENGDEAYREMEFDGEYIDIPYDMAESTNIKKYIEEDEDLHAVLVDGDIIGGDPVGYYEMQFDSQGNIVKISGL